MRTPLAGRVERRVGDGVSHGASLPARLGGTPPLKVCRSSRCISSRRAFGTARSTSNVRSRVERVLAAVASEEPEREQRAGSRCAGQADAAQFAQDVRAGVVDERAHPFLERPGLRRPVSRRTIPSMIQRSSSTPTASSTKITARKVECTTQLDTTVSTTSTPATTSSAVPTDSVIARPTR